MTAQRMQGNRAARPGTYHYKEHDYDNDCGGEYPCVPVEVNAESLDRCDDCGGELVVEGGLRRVILLKGRKTHAEFGDCVRHLAAQIEKLTKPFNDRGETPMMWAERNIAALRERVEKLEEFEKQTTEEVNDMGGDFEERIAALEKRMEETGSLLIRLSKYVTGREDPPPPPKASGLRTHIHGWVDSREFVEGISQMDGCDCKIIPPAEPVTPLEKASEERDLRFCLDMTHPAGVHQRVPSCSSANWVTPPAPEPRESGKREHRYDGKRSTDWHPERPDCQPESDPLSEYRPAQRDENDGRSGVGPDLVAALHSESDFAPVAGSNPASSLSTPAADAIPEWKRKLFNHWSNKGEHSPSPQPPTPEKREWTLHAWTDVGAVECAGEGRCAVLNDEELHVRVVEKLAGEEEPWKLKPRYVRVCDHCGYAAVVPPILEARRCTDCGKPAAWFREVLNPKRASRQRRKEEK